MSRTTDTERRNGVEVLRNRTLVIGADNEYIPRMDALGRDNLDYGDFEMGVWVPTATHAHLTAIVRASQKYADIPHQANRDALRAALVAFNEPAREPLPGQHVVAVRLRRRVASGNPVETWAVRCACGWVGADRDSEAESVADGAAHLRVHDALRRSSGG